MLIRLKGMTELDYWVAADRIEKCSESENPDWAFVKLKGITPAILVRMAPKEVSAAMAHARARKAKERGRVLIWTDGACWPNPGGPGAWAAIVTYGERELELSGYERSTTNNRMEIMGAIAGLRALKRPCDVTIFSDSQYLVRTMNCGWRKRKNADLWQQLAAACKEHRVTWKWVRGHADDVMNNRADALAGKVLAKRGTQRGVR